MLTCCRWLATFGLLLLLPILVVLQANGVQAQYNNVDQDNIDFLNDNNVISEVYSNNEAIENDHNNNDDFDDNLGDNLDSQPAFVIDPYDENNDNDDTDAYILPVSKPVGQVTGLGLNSKGQLLAFHRADRSWDQWTFDKKNRLNSTLGVINNHTIFVIDPRSGQVVQEHGKGIFYMPHGLTVDSKDNIWVTDIGLHQVIKLDKNFKILLKLGEHLKPGSDKQHFCKPTDVAVAKNGHFFVADGYCNNRIMKFDQHGKLLASFGAPNDGDGQFWIPHSLALIEDFNLICVADRENERIQCFSAGLKDDARALSTGIFITKADNIGRVYAIREKHHNLVGATGSDGEGIEPQIFVMNINNGKASTFAKGIENVHCLAVSDDGVVYVGQIGPNQIIEVPLRKGV